MGIRRAVAWALLTASASAFGATIEWPAAEVPYKGKLRDAGWWDRTFAHFKSRVAWIDGCGVDMQHIYTQELHLGHASRVRGRITWIMDDDEFVISVRSATAGLITGDVSSSRELHIRGIKTAGLADGEIWEGTVAIVGTNRAGWQVVKSARPLPPKGTELTREQYIEVIKSGFELATWERRPTPKSQSDHLSPPYTDRRVPVN